MNMFTLCEECVIYHAYTKYHHRKENVDNKANNLLVKIIKTTN